MFNKVPTFLVPSHDSDQAQEHSCSRGLPLYIPVVSDTKTVMYTRKVITVNQEQKSCKISDLCEFLFGENMVMPLVDLLATYYGDEESI
jgi:hypothetical protein